MRTPRILILVTFFAAFFLLLVISFRTPSRPRAPAAATSSSTSPNSFGPLYFTAPLSLFPPNAIISLTDDNTTSFLARPAAFGPPLPKHGLSGQLWIGSGFGDEGFRHGSLTDQAEGEQGCSDVLAWNQVHKKSTLPQEPEAKPAANLPHSRKGHPDDSIPVNRDGTDDHFHNPLPGSATAKDGKAGHVVETLGMIDTKHADIQSIQEGAEIEGKVVLLSRGGCGFLEKVMWAQRRGGIAVIVGDDTRGGPLIQMYARGDTSNVSIPSVFTSHTTAHLLSSLIPPGTYIEDTIDEFGNAVQKVQPPTKKKKTSKKKGQKTSQSPAKKPAVPVKSESTVTWIGRIVFGPPDNDKAGEVLDDSIGGPAKAVKNYQAQKQANQAADQAPDDGFQIGIQDWRDPDLVKKPGDAAAEQALTVERAAAAQAPPGSAVAGKGVANYVDSGKPPTAASGLLNTIFGDDHDIAEAVEDDEDEDEEDDEPPYNGHEGLWVTLSQTSGATPFFDTLLVLVVSPLVTLTVVYGLLLIRSRIRRRRWRAPKSVVEQLPVRTYQSVNIAHSSPSSSRVPSPSGDSPTTPLLQTRPRPRSRTTSGLPEPGPLSRQNSAQNLSAPLPKQRSHEKKGSEWKKYMGRQVECVVCLEEYVDGVSRVMSLPCGHEFHVECMQVTSHRPFLIHH